MATSATPQTPATSITSSAPAIGRQPSTRFAGRVLRTIEQLERLFNMVVATTLDPIAAQLNAAVEELRDPLAVQVALEALAAWRADMGGPARINRDAAHRAHMELEDAIHAVRCYWRHGGRGWSDATREEGVRDLEEAMAGAPVVIGLLSLAWSALGPDSGDGDDDLDAA